MDELLTPVSRTLRNNEEPLLQQVSSKVQTTKKVSTSDTFSPDSVAEALKSEPDYDTLISVLTTLAQEQDKNGGFKIGNPGPQAAKIIQILITEITPNYWTLLRESSADAGGSDIQLLLGVLRNFAGLNAILLRIKTLTQAKRAEAPENKRSDIELNLSISLDLLCEVLHGDDRVYQLWATAVAGLDATKHRILSRELVNVIGGGRIISLSAEGDSIVSRESKGRLVWTAVGAKYSDWLARNVIAWSKKALTAEDKKMAADLLAKCLRLGYLDEVVKLVVSDLASDPQAAKHIRGLYDNIAYSEQRSMLFGVLKSLSNLHLNDADVSSDASQLVPAAAGIIDRIVAGDARHTAHLVAWLTSATGAGLGDSIGIRRVVLAVLAPVKDNIVTVFDKSLSQFGDYLYIRHTPMLQQEVHAQVLLLSAGYLKRLAPPKLSLFVKSGSFMQMVSKRLKASQTRARLLGMIVGEALSGMVLGDDKKLNFHMEETTSEEALWLKGLTKVSDDIGSVDVLASRTNQTPPDAEVRARPPQKPKPTVAKPPPTRKAKAIIQVVDSDEDMDDDDNLVPLKKPDDDDEESNEDPETVRRDRPKAPVYIRNLIAYLRDTENYDRQKLALTTAPVLIRRKANFGTEVQEHAEELAMLLVGIQDKFGIENFYELKVQGMIAIVVARPQKMGPWFAKTFFDGDFSAAQRSSVLTVLGLSARELAGLSASEYAQATTAFPSQALPDRMKKLYVEDNAASGGGLGGSSSALKALPPNALDTISKSLTSDFMAPIAANAADAATGPDALKLSTFTARLEQQKSSTAVSKSRAKPRLRAIPNTMAQVIATSFFFPLTARFQSAVHATAGRARSIVFQPFLLSLYVKTLALLLHAAGPTTLALTDMTSEFWSLLLGSSVRAHAVGDLGVTHAVLFALLTILEVNEDRMRDVCQTMAREVVETQEWVAQVFHGLRGDGTGGEEADAKALAAGVLVRIQEGMEKYRMLLMGDMIG